MKIAPIIHTRTFSCDFNSEFMVRPNDFLDSDVKWARKEVLTATNSIDRLNGERWLIVDNGKYRIVGIVSFLKNLSEKCSLNEEEGSDAESFYYDDKGRLVYAFIGIVVHSNESVDNFVVTYDYLWKMYVKYLKSIWKQSYTETILSEYKIIEASKRPNIPNMKSQKIDQIELYETNPTKDKELFDYYLTSSVGKEFTFCSNISDIKILKDRCFSIVTTANNVITRLKRELSESNSGISSLEMDSKPRRPVQDNNIQNNNTKKKNSVPLQVCLMIFAAIILSLLFLWGK